jgi:hypothetical protein
LALITFEYTYYRNLSIVLRRFAGLQQIVKVSAAVTAALSTQLN